MARTITEIISTYIKMNGIVQAHVAEQLKERPQNMGRKLKRDRLDTEYVKKISIILKHDFFSDLSAELKKEMEAKEEAAVLEQTPHPYTKPVSREEYEAAIKEVLDLYRKMEDLREEAKRYKELWQKCKGGKKEEL